MQFGAEADGVAVETMQVPQRLRNERDRRE